MIRYEYKVVPAPTKGLKGKNIKGSEARFSNALQDLMNSLSGYGWEYQRAETLPSTERSGLTGSTTEWRNVLVFRRPRAAADAPEAEHTPPLQIPAPSPAAPSTTAPEPQADATPPEDVDLTDPVEAKKAEIARAPRPYSEFGEGENGVEDASQPPAATSALSRLALKRKKSAGPD